MYTPYGLFTSRNPLSKKVKRKMHYFWKEWDFLQKNLNRQNSRLKKSEKKMKNVNENSNFKNNAEKTTENGIKI